MSVTSIKRRDGKTVYDVRVQYKGIRISRRIMTTMTEAKRVEAKFRTDLIKGNYEILTDREDPTFREYAERYKKTIAWQKSYRKTLSKVDILINYFGKMRLSEIT